MAGHHVWNWFTYIWQEFATITIFAKIVKIVKLLTIFCYFANFVIVCISGHKWECWPEVVAVRTERNEVRTKTTEGQYSPVRLEQARLVSSLLYGTLFLIVKCTSGGLHLKMSVFCIYLWNFGKISIFLASSDSFNVKNDIIHTFFPVLVANFIFAGFVPKQKYTDWTVSMKRSILRNPDPERTNQSTGIYWVCHIIMGIYFFSSIWAVRNPKSLNLTG